MKRNNDHQCSKCYWYGTMRREIITVNSFTMCQIDQVPVCCHGYKPRVIRTRYRKPTWCPMKGVAEDGDMWSNNEHEGETEKQG